MTVLGHRPPADICDLLVHAAEHDAIYVCASDKEEFGLAIVEALAAGLVVVAPQRGGPRTYIDHGRNGVLCDTASVPAIAEAIDRRRHDASGSGSASGVACARTRRDVGRRDGRDAGRHLRHARAGRIERGMSCAPCVTACEPRASQRRGMRATHGQLFPRPCGDVA